jgi:dTMP kinase
MPKNKIFIAFEGIDGSGKYTQAIKIKNFYENLNYIVGFSSEPNDNEFGGSPLGKTIRKMLKGELKKPAHPLEFQRIYVADRFQDSVSFITPFLEGDENPRAYVIERFKMSTFAYGMLSGASPEIIAEMHNAVGGTLIPEPDAYIFIDISAEEAMKRIEVRGAQKEHFEKKEFLEKIRNNYLSLSTSKYFSDTAILINGEQTQENVFEDVKKALKERNLTP